MATWHRPMKVSSTETQRLQAEVKRLRTWLKLIHKTDKGYQDLCWDFARKALHGNKPPKE